MDTPDSIKADEPNYKPDAWHGYSIQELGAWVHLLAKRAVMRSDPEKAAKDIKDARAYLGMMTAQVDAAEKLTVKPDDGERR